MKANMIAYIACDSNLCINEASTHAAELLQLTDYDLHGHILTDVCLPLVGSEAQIASILSGSTPHLSIEQINIKTPLETTRYVSIVVLPHAIVLPEASGLLVIIHDVTEQSLQQQRTQQQQGELALLHQTIAQQQEQLRSLEYTIEVLSHWQDDILSFLMHDVREPINAIVHASDALLHQSEQSAPSSSQQHISRIHQESWHLFHHLESLFLLHQAQLASTPVHHPIPIGRLLQETVTFYQQQSPPPSIPINPIGLEADSPVHTLIVDVLPDLLRHAVLSLLNQHLRHTVDETHVRLSLLSEAPQLDPPLDETTRWCALDIVNIAPYDANDDEPLPPPLPSLPKDISDQTTSETVGLTLVQRIVAHHHGRLLLQRGPDHTTFTILLPCRIDTPDSSHHPPNP